MFCFVKYDNCKKLSKVTKIRKSLIKIVDNMSLYDVGYIYGEYLIISKDADDIDLPHVLIKRMRWGEIVVHRCKSGVVNSVFYEDQPKAIFFALEWLRGNLPD